MFSATLNNIEPRLSVIAIMYFMGGLAYFMGRSLSLLYGQFSILRVMLSILWVATYFKGALYYNGATLTFLVFKFGHPSLDHLVST